MGHLDIYNNIHRTHKITNLKMSLQDPRPRAGYRSGQVATPVNSQKSGLGIAGLGKAATPISTSWDLGQAGLSQARPGYSTCQ